MAQQSHDAGVAVLANVDLEEPGVRQRVEQLGQCGYSRLYLTFSGRTPAQLNWA